MIAPLFNFLRSEPCKGLQAPVDDRNMFVQFFSDISLVVSDTGS